MENKRGLEAYKMFQSAVQALLYSNGNRLTKMVCCHVCSSGWLLSVSFCHIVILLSPLLAPERAIYLLLTIAATSISKQPCCDKGFSVVSSYNDSKYSSSAPATLVLLVYLKLIVVGLVAFFHCTASNLGVLVFLQGPQNMHQFTTADQWAKWLSIRKFPVWSDLQ